MIDPLRYLCTIESLKTFIKILSIKVLKLIKINVGIYIVTKIWLELNVKFDIFYMATYYSQR